MGKTNMLFPFLAVAVLGFSAHGCDHPSRNASIIKQYMNATCVSPYVTGTVPFMVWEHTVTLRTGSKVRIDAAQIPSGRVDVTYLDSGIQYTAADAGDYIYPSDVRIAGEMLYSKTDGLLAADGSPRQTWLFSFDLAHRELLDRVCVDRNVLPAECERPKTEH